jgi:predicted dehydrogenase
MNRSRPAVQNAIKFMQDGGIGKIYMARGLCFKPRLSIGKYPDGPMAPGEQYKLSSAATSFEPAYDAAYLSKVDYDMWLGPAPKRPFNRNRFHYNWHWHWEYGNGDTGNQGPHQFDIARWGLGKQEHPIKVVSTGGYFGAESSQETPDTQTAIFEYADGTILEFATRGEHTNDEGSIRIGDLFYGSKGWVWIDETGRNWQSYLGPVGDKNQKGPGSGSAAQGGDAVGLTTSEGSHFQNFIDAIRANDPKILKCDIMEGHLSSTLPHLANISYRVGHQLRFDPKSERFEDDKKADALLNRDGGYRKGFEIPKSFT